MTAFESTVIINKPVEEVYNFLADLNNHQALMPDTIQDWSSTADTIRFNIPNIAKLSLIAESRIENSEIKIIPLEKAPFNMELLWALTPDEGGTKVLFTIFADLNMMLKMLASGPLQKLADHETESLATRFR